MKLKIQVPATLLISMILSFQSLPAPNIFARQRMESVRPGIVPLRTRATNAQIVSRLEKSIPRLMKDGEVPGLSIALVRNGEMAWHRGFGVKNSKTLEPVNDSTVFEAASLSKPVFAYAVFKLVDAGKLDLDKPLNTYLPGNYDVGEDERLNQITARRVLSHTTGLPNWRPRGGALKILFTPGERFSYSGEGYVYLAKVVEHITEEKFDDFMKRSVFEPLGMASSSYVWQDSYDRLKTFSHNTIGEPAQREKLTQPNAAASLHTTAQDYGRFVAAILKGTGLKPVTRKEMLTPQIRVGEGGTNHTDGPAERLLSEVAWGLGWGLQMTADGLSFWHWGDNGDSKSYVVAFEKQKLGVVAFANSTTGLSIVREIVNDAVGGDQPALAWLDYEAYNSPSKNLLKTILAKGVETALLEYREWRRGRAPNEVVKENQMNRLGYDLITRKRIKDAIEIFKLNVQDYPQSFNTHDSLGEVYMLAGDKEQAIKNYQRSVELNPENTGGIEALKKLRGSNP